MILINEPEVILNDPSVQHELHMQVRCIRDLNPRISILVNEADHAVSWVGKHNLRNIQYYEDQRRRVSTSSEAPMPAMPITVCTGAPGIVLLPRQICWYTGQV